MKSTRALALFVAAVVSAAAGVAAQQPAVTTEAHHDTSPPLRSLEAQMTTGPHHLYRPRRTPLRHNDQPDPLASAPALVTSPATTMSVTTMEGFEGIGLSTGYDVPGAPSDPNGAAGTTQVVEMVNLAFGVYSKNTGQRLFGPTATNTLWKGFGGACEHDNDGDGTVLFDHFANRWLLSQFAVANGPPYYECVAISQTADATGKWYRYAFKYDYFPDYPKIGIWRDAYYVSYNMYQGPYWGGPELCALQRSAMLQGHAAKQQCVMLSGQYGSLLPADVDGARLPSSSAPELFLALGASNDLLLWRYHVNWTSPSYSKLSGPTKITVAPYTEACQSGSCVPQSWTSQRLDALGDRLMYRLAYRNFGDHQALVTNHTVRPGNGAAAGVRWYELRSTGGGWSLYQQQTYAPDKNSRWMASMAMDKIGHIAIGYSISSAAMHPGIRYTGRAASTTKSTLLGENAVLSGGGSQHQIDRWGDYSSMSIDPADDCTFWYTNQYLTHSGSYNWSTHVNSFKFPTCY